MSIEGGGFELDASELDELGRALEMLPIEKQERIATIRDMRRKGMSVGSIAKLLGVSESTIQRDFEWLRKYLGSFINRFDHAEDIGAAVTLYQEIEDRCMDLSDTVSREYEVEVTVGSETKKVLKEPDHFAAKGYLELAVKARKERTQLLQQVGMLKDIPLKSESGGMIDVSKLTGDDLIRARDEAAAKVVYLRDKYARISGGATIKGSDS